MIKKLSIFLFFLEREYKDDKTNKLKRKENVCYQ